MATASSGACLTATNVTGLNLTDIELEGCGLHFDVARQLRLTGLTVRDAGSAAILTGGAVIADSHFMDAPVSFGWNSSATIRNSTFTRSGIQLNESSSDIAESQFTDSSISMNAFSQNVQIVGNAFDGSRSTIEISPDSAAVIRNNEFQGVKIGVNLSAQPLSGASASSIRQNRFNDSEVAGVLVDSGPPSEVPALTVEVTGNIFTHTGFGASTVHDSAGHVVDDAIHVVAMSPVNAVINSNDMTDSAGSGIEAYGEVSGGDNDAHGDGCVPTTICAA